MIILDPINKISLFITLCMCLLITNKTLSFHKSSLKLGLTSSVFVFPFIIISSILLNSTTHVPIFFLLLSQLVPLLLSIIILLTSYKNPNPQFNYLSVFVLIAVALAFCQVNLPFIATNRLTRFFPYLIIISALSYIFLLQRTHKKISLPTYSLLLLSGAQILLVTPQVFAVKSVYLFMIGLSTLLFLIYFYQQTYSNTTNEILEANQELKQKLAALNRSIDTEVKKRTLEIERSNRHLLDISRIDALTNIYNKINILGIINALINTRNPDPFTILMFDIDNFKAINDEKGHIYGDMTLKQLAATANKSIRNIDSLGRYGGDEFIVVLPKTTVEDARIIAERIRQSVESSVLGCTVSIGIAAFPIDGNTERMLIKSADEGLYLSKQSGRNKVSYNRENN
ncbi:MAG: GGDEF domain-containing protein [Bacillota bacterium]|nr:GGDEF domain-containing protein [Bacillota bacterium]